MPRKTILAKYAEEKEEISRLVRIGVDNMVGGQSDVKLVSNAMANATRRKIMAMITESNRTQEEISKSVGPTMLDYHLQMLQQAGLVDMKDGTVILTDF